MTATAVVVCLSPSFGTTAPGALDDIEACGASVVRVRGPGGGTQDADGQLARARALIVGTEAVDADLLARAPEIAIVAKHGAGLDNIDVEAATRAGVAVTAAPGANATAVAELTLGLVIGLARGIVWQDARVRAGRWGVAVGKALQGSTLGVVGLGRIGRLVATRAAAFDMQVLAHDIVAEATPPRPEDPWTFTDLPALLAASDFVTLHVPLAPDTRGLIDAQALRRMKPTAYLVNAARGGVVDEAALDEALRDGVISGAALDTFAEEPLDPGHPLAAQRERTIVTPHMGAYTDRALADTSRITARNVVAALRGQWPPDAVNSPNTWRGRR